MTTTVSTSQFTCTCCKSRTPDLYGVCDKCINGTMGGLDTFTQLYTDLVAQCRSRDLSESGTIEDMQARIEADEQEHQFCSMARDEEDGTPTDIDMGSDSEPCSIPTTTRTNDTTTTGASMNVTTTDSVTEARQEVMSPTPTTTIPDYMVDSIKLGYAASHIRGAISMVTKVPCAQHHAAALQTILESLADYSDQLILAGHPLPNNEPTVSIDPSYSSFQDHPWHSPRLNLRTVTDLHNAHVNAYLLWLNTYATAKEPIILPPVTTPTPKVEQSAIRQPADVHTHARLTGTDSKKAKSVKGLKCHCGKPVWIGSHTNSCFQHTPVQVDKSGKSLINTQTKAEAQVAEPKVEQPTTVKVEAPVQQPKVDRTEARKSYKQNRYNLKKQLKQLGLPTKGTTKDMETILQTHKVVVVDAQVNKVQVDSTVKVQPTSTIKVPVTNLESQAQELYRSTSTSKLQAMCSIKGIKFYPTEAKLILARRLVGINT